MLQCLEAGFFDAIESLGEPSTLETLSKKFGYNLEILERLLNALISYNLISVDQNKRGKYNICLSTVSGRWLSTWTGGHQK